MNHVLTYDDGINRVHLEEVPIGRGATSRASIGNDQHYLRVEALGVNVPTGHLSVLNLVTMKMEFLARDMWVIPTYVKVDIRVQDTHDRADIDKDETQR